MKARIGFLILGLMLTLMPSAHAAVVVPGCGDAAAAGGEWRSYGGSASNDRNQTSESALNVSTVANVAQAWNFNPQNAEYIDPTTQVATKILNGGAFDNTPVIADGCVFLATTTGWVIAINAQIGAPINPVTGLQRVVWATLLDGGPLQLRSDVITGSPAVENGMVFVGVTRPGTATDGPYLAALDETSGADLWESVVEVGQDSSGIAASPVFLPASASAPSGMVFQGFYGSEGLLPNTSQIGNPAKSLPSRGGYAFVDASRACDSAILLPPSKCFNQSAGAQGGFMKKHEHTITDAEYAQGYRGASVWCTAAYDPDTQDVYACGGNPVNAHLESRYANALLKIDGDPSSATFGKIVDAYKGTTDQYYPGLNHQPVCDVAGDKVLVLWSQPCGQLDLDFGSSPQLFKVRIGAGSTFETRTLVGDLQKAGIYHAVWADNMQGAWTAQVGVPCPSCNAGSTALDTDANGFVNQVYVTGTPPGQMMALSGRQEGRLVWAQPFGEGTHFEATTTANGVVYGVDNAGTLGMFDASNGVPLARRLLAVDVNDSTAGSSSQGIAIARNSIFVFASNYLVVLR